MKKGQAATEYLIVLSVVIVIALIVVAVIGGIPSIGTAGQARASSAYWQVADVAITSYSASPNGVTLNVRNNLNDQITLTAFTLDGNSVLSSSNSFSVGESKTITSSSPNCTAGNAYSFDVSITYNHSATGSVYTFTGDGTKLTGTCANG